MTSRANPVATMLLAGALAAPLPSGVAAAEAAGPSDSAAARSVWAVVDAMWNARDAERFSRLFTENASFEFVDRGQSLDGRATILEHFAERFPRYAQDLRHRTSIRQVLTIAPDVLATDGKVEILRIDPNAGAKPAVLRTFAIFSVMTRSLEGWKVRALRVYELRVETDDAGGR